MSRDCQHGHLARSCELCERDNEIARLREETVKLRDAARAYRDLCTCYRIGKQPTEKLWKKLDAAHAALDGAKESP